jgi:hypothetical protein
MKSRATIADKLQLIRSEYLELPDLHLTQRQVERLWGLDSVTAETLLRALTDVRFLRVTRNGAYVRANKDEEARSHRPSRRGVRWHPKREPNAA